MLRSFSSSPPDKKINELRPRQIHTDLYVSGPIAKKNVDLQQAIFHRKGFVAHVKLLIDTRNTSGRNLI